MKVMWVKGPLTFQSRISGKLSSGKKVKYFKSESHLLPIKSNIQEIYLSICKCEWYN